MFKSIEQGREVQELESLNDVSFLLFPFGQLPLPLTEDSAERNKTDASASTPCDVGCIFWSLCIPCELILNFRNSNSFE